MSNLNPRQQAAIQTVNAPLLVLAGAGSGKTRVITHKIVHLITQNLYAASHITAVTFTNKAAREMKTRVGKLLRREQTRGLRLCTFHALGLDIIRREYQHLGRKANFSLFDATDSASLIRELRYKLPEHIGVTGDFFAERISAWKNALLTPEQISIEISTTSESSDSLESQALSLYNEYQRSLRAYNAVDFDDLITLPVQLFSSHPEALEYWRGRIRYLLVDEYQDTNGAQYELVRHLVGIRGQFTVVGDDDQSIYAWRGARPKNLVQLQQDFTNLKVIKLEQNYRSSKRILQLANLLIKNNSHVFEKQLWSDLGLGDPIRVLACRDEQHEAEKIVTEILHHKLTTNNKYTFGDYAILYRSNYQSRPFEKALQELNVPYYLSGGTSFFARTEIKDLMAYLRLLVNPDDDAAFLRIVNIPRRDIGPVTLERLAAYAQERHSSLLEVCNELGLSGRLDEKARWNLGKFAELIETYSRKAETNDPLHTIQELITEIDYFAWLKESSNNANAAKRRIENVTELTEWLARMRTGEYADATLLELIKRLTLFDVLERQTENDKGDRVNLMTLHAAKGLEFSHVFIAGMEEQLLPHRNSIELDTNEAMEEERRLAYVGITRARRTLTFSLAAQRRYAGEMMSCEPSRFLAELEEAELIWIGERSEISKEEKRKRGALHLAELKNVFGDI